MSSSLMLGTASTETIAMLDPAAVVELSIRSESAASDAPVFTPFGSGPLCAQLWLSAPKPKG